MSAWWTYTRFRLLHFKDRKADDKHHGNQTEPAPIRAGRFNVKHHLSGWDVCESGSSALILQPIFTSLFCYLLQYLPLLSWPSSAASPLHPSFHSSSIFTISAQTKTLAIKASGRPRGIPLDRQITSAVRMHTNAEVCGFSVNGSAVFTLKLFIVQQRHVLLVKRSALTLCWIIDTVEVCEHPQLRLQTGNTS